MSNESTGDKPHFTTRRGFIVAAGFGVVSLYGLWVAYGAAPLGLRGGSAPAESGLGEHGGEHGDARGMAPQEFKRHVEAFVEANKLPDGSVRPARRGSAEPASSAAHDMAMQDSARRGEAPAAPHDNQRDAVTEAVDVYLMAFQWGYAPAVLRLETGVPYRLRMMAVDAAHGASLQLGNGGRIIRLRPNALVEQTLTFERPGEYLLYCTVYCGLAHDRMQGKIIVTEPSR